MWLERRRAICCTGSVMSSRTKLITATAVLVASFGLLYRHVIWKLVYDWSHDENYSHGFLILPLAAYFVWERRHRLEQVPIRSSAVGLLILLVSTLVLLAGLLGAELFLTRAAMLGTLVGAILFVLGWQY